MQKFLDKVAATVMPLIGMLIFVALLVLAIIFFSYVFIIITIIGFLLFAVGYIRALVIRHKHMKAYNKQHTSGRTIDHKEEK